MSKLRDALTFPLPLRPAAMLAAFGFVGQLVLTGWWWVGSMALTIGCLIYIIGWFNGYRTGGDIVHALYIDGHVKAMEKVVERIDEEYAPDAPERVAASQQLAELRRVQREISR